MHKTFSSLRESIIIGKENLDNLLKVLPKLEEIQNDINNEQYYPVLIYRVLKDNELLLDGYLGYADEIILQTVLPKGYMVALDPKLYLDDKLISIPIRFKKGQSKKIQFWEKSELMLSNTYESYCLLGGDDKIAYGWDEINNTVKSINPNIELSNLKDDMETK